MKKKTFSCFFIPYAVFAVIWFSLIVIYEKGELHLMLNLYRSPFLDTFFTYFTDGRQHPLRYCCGLSFPPNKQVVLPANHFTCKRLTYQRTEMVLWCAAPKNIFRGELS